MNRIEKMKWFWEDLNGIIFLCTLGMFHGGVLISTIIFSLNFEIPLIPKVLMFLIFYPINHFTITIFIDEIWE